MPSSASGSLAGPADGPRRRDRRDRAQDVPALAAAATAGRSRPAPSSRPRAHLDRRAHGGIRRRRHPHPRRRRRRPRRRCPTTGRSRSSTRAARSRRSVRVEPRRRRHLARDLDVACAPPARSSTAWSSRGRACSTPSTCQRGPHMTDYTSFDVAHIGNIELLTPKFDESLWFFRDLLAMRVVAEAGRLGLPAHVGRVPALHDQAHRVGCRRRRPHHVPHAPARRRSSAASPRSRRPGSARAGSTARSGTGPTYLFRDPDGHSMGIYYETERYVATDDKPALKNQASAFPGRGVNARRLDHINYLAKDVVANGEFIAHGPRRPRERADRAGRRRVRGLVVPLQQQVLRRRLLRRLDQARQPAAPHRVRARHPRGHPQGRRHLPRERHLHRVRPAQARDQPDVLPLRLGAGRQPHRVRQRRRPAAAGPRLSRSWSGRRRSARRARPGA